MKEKIKDVKFWISIGSALILILSFLTNNFGIEQDVFVEVYSCILAVLTTLGVLTRTSKSDKESSVDELQNEIRQELENNSKKDK